MTEEEEECWSEAGWPRLSDTFLLETLQSAPHRTHGFLTFALSTHPKNQTCCCTHSESITQHDLPEQAAFYTDHNHCSLTSCVN